MPDNANTVDFSTLMQCVADAKRVFVAVHDSQDRVVNRVRVTKRWLAESFREAGRLPMGATYHIEWIGQTHYEGFAPTASGGDLLIL